MAIFCNYVICLIRLLFDLHTSKARIRRSTISAAKDDFDVTINTKVYSKRFLFSDIFFMQRPVIVALHGLFSYLFLSNSSQRKEN